MKLLYRRTPGEDGLVYEVGGNVEEIKRGRNYWTGHFGQSRSDLAFCAIVFIPHVG